MSGEWIAIEDANVEGWCGNMKIDEIEKMTNYQTQVLVPYELQHQTVNPKFQKRYDSSYSGGGLWYTESRNFLFSCGVVPVLNEEQKTKQDCTVPFAELFWAENLYQSQPKCAFKGSNTPVLLTQHVCADKDATNKIHIILWATNTVQNMNFRGCALIDKSRLSPVFTHVRPLFEGTITNTQLKQFLQGVPPLPKEEFKYDPLPSLEFIESQIIERNITKWHIHDCSFCKYPCGYRFEVAATKVVVYYDNGCYCVSNPWRKSSTQDIIDHIALQSTRKAVEDIRIFWNHEVGEKPVVGG